MAFALTAKLITKANPTNEGAVTIAKYFLGLTTSPKHQVADIVSSGPFSGLYFLNDHHQIMLAYLPSKVSFVGTSSDKVETPSFEAGMMLHRQRHFLRKSLVTLSPFSWRRVLTSPQF